MTAQELIERLRAEACIWEPSPLTELLRTTIAALTAQEGREREIYEAGFTDGASSIGKFGEQIETAEEAFADYQARRTATGEK